MRWAALSLRLTLGAAASASAIERGLPGMSKQISRI
jgi:hypothetical protein